MRTARVAEVEQILDAHIRGTREADPALLGSLLHPRTVVAGHLAAAYSARGSDAFIERAATTPASADDRAATTEVALTGETATGTSVEDGLRDGLCFVSRFHLIRDPGGARVINARLFHQDAADQGS